MIGGGVGIGDEGRDGRGTGRSNRSLRFRLEVIVTNPSVGDGVEGASCGEAVRELGTTVLNNIMVKGTMGVGIFGLETIDKGIDPLEVTYGGVLRNFYLSLQV